MAGKYKHLREICPELLVNPMKISEVTVLREDGEFTNLMVIIDGVGIAFKEWEKAQAMWNLVSDSPLQRTLEVL